METCKDCAGVHYVNPAHPVHARLLKDMDSLHNHPRSSCRGVALFSRATGRPALVIRRDGVRGWGRSLQVVPLPEARDLPDFAAVCIVGPWGVRPPIVFVDIVRGGRGATRDARLLGLFCAVPMPRHISPFIPIAPPRALRTYLWGSWHPMQSPLGPPVNI